MALFTKEMAQSEPLCYIVTMVGVLGYGFEEHEMRETLERLSADSIPIALLVDSGSIGSGPGKLAMPRSAYERDIDRLLKGGMHYKIPLLFGSAGGAGTNQNVDSLTEIVEEVSRKQSASSELVVTAVQKLSLPQWLSIKSDQDLSRHLEGSSVTEVPGWKDLALWQGGADIAAT